MTYEISVIIPVYNVENYIRQALDSVVSQTLGIDNIEVIIVNDCTPDNSMEIVNEFANKYPSFKVINLETNKGQGEARNVGLQHVTSDYVTFLDSDDFLSENVFEDSINKIKSNNADLLIYNWEFFTEGFVEPPTIHKPNFTADKVITDIKDKPELVFITSPWNKIYHKNLFKYLDFPSQFYEDNVVAVETLINASKIYLNQGSVYNYRKNNESTTHKLTIKNLNDLTQSIKQLFGLIEKYPDYSKLIKPLAIKFIQDVLIWIYNYDWTQEEEVNAIKDLQQSINPISKDDLNDFKRIICKYTSIFEEDILNLNNYEAEEFLARYKFYQEEGKLTPFATLFLDVGDSFNEQDKISIKYCPSSINKLSFDLTPFENISKLRFDPLEGEFTKIKIESISSEDIEIIPINNDMELSDEYNVFLNLDPNFELVGDFTNISTLEITFSVEILDKTELNDILISKNNSLGLNSPSNTAHLYIDDGNGFNEDNIIPMDFKYGKDKIKFDLSGFNNLQGVRFDPIEGIYSKVKINSISSDLDTIKVNFSNADFNFEGYDVFSTLDPYYVISGDLSECSYLEIDFEIEFLNINQIVELFKLEMDKNLKELTEIKSKKIHFNFK